MFAILLLWWASFGYPIEITVCEPANGSDKCSAHYVPVGIIRWVLFQLDRYGVLLTAIFTAFIAWFTWTLRESTEKMWGETRKAANAAEKAANAAVSVELPIISVTGLRLADVQGVTLNGGVPHHINRFSMGFKNSGRTVATLIEQCIEDIVTSALPDVPIYEHLFPFSPGTLVEAGKPSTASIQNYFIELTDEQRKAIEKIEMSLWVYGYIAFRDFNGDRHEHRFCARWVPFKAGVAADTPTGFVYSSDTPTEYTRST